MNYFLDYYFDFKSGANSWKIISIVIDSCLRGNSEEKFEEFAHQVGSFSRTLVEVSSRYVELYWAGMDGNWEYGHN